MKDQFREKLTKNMMWFDRIMNNITEEQFDIQVQDEGDQWTVIQVLRHIAYSELSMVRLIEDLLEGKDEIPEDYSLKDANKKGQEILKDKGLESIRARMDKSRSATLELLDRINDEDWTKEGRYFTGDIVTIQRMFEIIIYHQSHHSKTITNVLDTSTWN